MASDEVFEWTCDRTYLGGTRKNDLVFINKSPVACYLADTKTDCWGEELSPRLCVQQGMNREEFLSNLLYRLPDFCKENNITKKTVLDIWTKRELESRATICRINKRSQAKL